MNDIITRLNAIAKEQRDELEAAIMARFPRATVEFRTWVLYPDGEIHHYGDVFCVPTSLKWSRAIREIYESCDVSALLSPHNIQDSKLYGIKPREVDHV